MTGRCELCGKDGVQLRSTFTVVNGVPKSRYACPACFSAWASAAAKAPAQEGTQPGPAHELADLPLFAELETAHFC